MTAAWLAPPRGQRSELCKSFPGNDFSGWWCRRRTTGKNVSCRNLQRSCWDAWSGRGGDLKARAALSPAACCWWAKYRHRWLLGCFAALPEWFLWWMEISTSHRVGWDSHTDPQLWASAGQETFKDGDPPGSYNLPDSLPGCAYMLLV